MMTIRAYQLMNISVSRYDFLPQPSPHFASAAFDLPFGRNLSLQSRHGTRFRVISVSSWRMIMWPHASFMRMMRLLVPSVRSQHTANCSTWRNGDNFGTHSAAFRSSAPQRLARFAYGFEQA